MKQLVTNYTFNKTNGQITLIDFASIELERVLIITNVTAGIVIYQFNSPTKLATVSGNVIDLAYDTSAMNNNDDLMIYVDIEIDKPFPAQAERTENLLLMLQRVVKLMESLAIVDVAQRQRITLDAIAAGLTLATITTVGTVSNITAGTLTNVVANAGMDREQYINIAKQTYATSIRNQLTFA